MLGKSAVNIFRSMNRANQLLYLWVRSWEKVKVNHGLRLTVSPSTTSNLLLHLWNARRGYWMNSFRSIRQWICSFQWDSRLSICRTTLLQDKFIVQCWRAWKLLLIGLCRCRQSGQLSKTFLFEITDYLPRKLSTPLFIFWNLNWCYYDPFGNFIHDQNPCMKDASEHRVFSVTQSILLDCNCPVWQASDDEFCHCWVVTKWLFIRLVDINRRNMPMTDECRLRNEVHPSSHCVYWYTLIIVFGSFCCTAVTDTIDPFRPLIRLQSIIRLKEIYTRCVIRNHGKHWRCNCSAVSRVFSTRYIGKHTSFTIMTQESNLSSARMFQMLKRPWHSFGPVFSEFRCFPIFLLNCRFTKSIANGNTGFILLDCFSLDQKQTFQTKPISYGCANSLRFGRLKCFF